MQKESFKQFVQKLKAKDQASWNSCRFVLKRSIGHFLAARTHGPEEFDSIFQEVMVSVYQLLPDCHFENYSKFKSFVLAIADRKQKELQRRKRAERRLVSLEQALCADSTGKSEQQRLEDRHLLDDILHNLNERERRILIDFYCHNEKLTDIAVELQISAEHCRVLKHRALKKIDAFAMEYKNE